MHQIVALFSACIAVTLVAVTTNAATERVIKPLRRTAGPETFVVHPENFVVIGEANYYFGAQGAYLDYNTSANFCTEINMQLAGFESNTEWRNVLDYMTLNNLTYWYWTSGKWNANSSSWVWSYSGTEFASDDLRWDFGEPGVNDTEGVSINSASRLLWAEQFKQLNHLICEGPIPAPTV